MSRKLIGTIGLLALLASGCAEQEAETDVQHEWILRDSGAIQCESEGLSLEEMRQQLDSAGIAVREAACGTDGVMRTTVCGAPAGRVGLFEVPATDLEAAAALGFEPRSEFPDATATPCPDARPAS